MKRSLLMVSALLLAGFVGASFGKGSGPTNSGGGSYLEARSQIIDAHLRQIPGDYVLVMGDSHAESWLASTGCDLPVVNAGLAGATAESYSRFFANLSLPRPPRAIILMIGTNDALRRRIGDPDEAVTTYQRRVEALLKRAAEKTNSVTVTAIPPLDPKRAVGFSHEIAVRFSIALENTCSNQRCRFVDPFSDGAELFDGVHLINYASSYSRIWDEVCPAIGL